MRCHSRLSRLRLWPMLPTASQLRRLRLLPFVLPSLLAAQAPAYNARMLDSARFHQTIQSQIRIETGSAVTQERSGREGLIGLAAVAGDSGIALTGWFDSLSVWREAGGQRYEPETDGMVGGRYHGLLTAAGVYSWRDQPFIPDPVAEIAELGSAFDDLLPPVPTRDLSVGQSMTLEGGWRIERRSDSLAGRSSLQRYALSGERRRTAVGAELDSVTVEAATYEKESGTLVWDSLRGPLVWLREITMSAALPAKGPVRRAVRTQIEQSVRLERLMELPSH